MIPKISTFLLSFWIFLSVLLWMFSVHEWEISRHHVIPIPSLKSYRNYYHQMFLVRDVKQWAYPGDHINQVIQSISKSHPSVGIVNCQILKKPKKIQKKRLNWSLSIQKSPCTMIRVCQLQPRNHPSRSLTALQKRWGHRLSKIELWCPREDAKTRDKTTLMSNTIWQQRYPHRFF